MSDRIPVHERSSEPTPARAVLVRIIGIYLDVDAALLDGTGLENYQDTGVKASHLVIIDRVYLICRTVMKWFRETKAYGKAQTAGR